METLSKQSRDPDSDVLVILSDSMSNKYSKLPILLSRPKNISDAIRVPMSLTTFQFALQNGNVKLVSLISPLFQELTCSQILITYYIKLCINTTEVSPFHFFWMH